MQDLAHLHAYVLDGHGDEGLLESLDDVHDERDRLLSYGKYMLDLGLCARHGEQSGSVVYDKGGELFRAVSGQGLIVLGGRPYAACVFKLGE